VRIRSIKPEFYTDAKVGRCEPMARLLFIGLWGMADKNGVCEWHPDEAAVRLFPYDGLTISKMEALCAQLVTHGLIERYRYEGDEFLYVRNFSKHQVLHHTEKNSTRVNGPTPKDLQELADGGALQECTGSTPGAPPGSNGSAPGALQEGSGSAPSTGDGKDVGREGEGREGKGKEGEIASHNLKLCSQVRAAHMDCQRLQDFEILQVLRGAPPGSDLDEAVSTFAIHWANGVFSGSATPLKELSKYVYASARKKKERAAEDEPERPRKRLTE
jgi:hypothetical protein